MRQWRAESSSRAYAVIRDLRRRPRMGAAALDVRRPPERRHPVLARAAPTYQHTITRVCCIVYVHQCGFVILRVVNANLRVDFASVKFLRGKRHKKAVHTMHESLIAPSHLDATPETRATAPGGMSALIDATNKVRTTPSRACA